MNAKAFRHFYDYHFTENRKIWDSYVTPLSHEQFTQDVDYSHTSVRNQIVHMMSADDTWFSALRGVEIPEPLNPVNFDDRKIIRVYWDNLERTMRDYLAKLGDDMLFEKPFAEGGGTAQVPRVVAGAIAAESSGLPARAPRRSRSRYGSRGASKSRHHEGQQLF